MRSIGGGNISSRSATEAFHLQECRAVWLRLVTGCEKDGDVAAKESLSTVYAGGHAPLHIRALPRGGERGRAARPGYHSVVGTVLRSCRWLVAGRYCFFILVPFYAFSAFVLGIFAGSALFSVLRSACVERKLDALIRACSTSGWPAAGSKGQGSEP